MKIHEVLKDLRLLADNYDTIMSELCYKNIPDDNLVYLINGMPTTHTFGYEKVISDPLDKKSHSVFPYRDILFQHKALYSLQQRNKLNGTPSGKTFERTMTKARDYGLDDFVFSYLGIHEYYYAKSNDDCKPAFGVFLSPKLDYIGTNNANATLYDLESIFVGKKSPYNITLTPENARKLTAYEIRNGCKDFFEYWICKQYEEKNFYDNQMWASKREFHYENVVELEHFTAIIWPYQMRANQRIAKFEVANDALSEMEIFSKLHPQIYIYPYEWIVNDGKERFSHASFWITKKLTEDGHYPKADKFADEFRKNFVTH